MSEIYHSFFLLAERKEERHAWEWPVSPIDAVWLVTSCSESARRLPICDTSQSYYQSPQVFMGPQIRKRFYSCTIKSILTRCLTAWYGNYSAADRKMLQRVVLTAQYITGAKLPAFQILYTRRCQRKALKIVKDSSHPSQSVFSATVRQAVPEHQVWDQKAPEQLLPQSHKTATCTYYLNQSSQLQYHAPHWLGFGSPCI